MRMMADTEEYVPVLTRVAAGSGDTFKRCSSPKVSGKEMEARTAPLIIMKASDIVRSIIGKEIVIDVFFL